MCVAALSNGRVVSGSLTLKVWDVSSERCLHTLSGHTDWARRRRPVKPCVDCSPTPRRAQVNCVAVLPNGNIVSGSRDRSLKVWDVSSEQCLHTLSGHAGWARRRRQVEQSVDRSSTQRVAQVWCVTALSNGHVVSGSGRLRVWDMSTGQCLRTLNIDTGGARRRRPVEPRG